ncbi:MAG: long-chain fatty acid transporter [Nitrospira sp. CR1.3]|nr:long-chain fatty acid transporter [Nitrospira sp. CR1.3]
MRITTALSAATRWSSFAVLLVLGVPAVSHGEAFRVLDQGAAASGQGTAFAAQADDPSALHYNPAGMTQLQGVQFYGGLLLVGGSYNYTSPAGANYKGDLDGSIAWPPPIHFYLTASLDKYDIGFLKNLTLGIGVNSPYGLMINWPQNVPFSALDTRATLPMLDIKPTMAYRFNDYLSIGGGLDIYTFASIAGEGAGQVNSFIPPSTNVELRVKDTAVGYNVGVMLTPWRTDGKPRLNLAFVYRSQTTLNLNGNFLVNGGLLADARVDFTLPNIYTGAVAYWPIRDEEREWKLEVDIDYADWHSFKQLNIQLSNGVTLPEPRNWNGVFIAHVGTEYKWLRPAVLPDWEVAARFGYIRSQTPVPEQTFEPAVPDANYNSFSVGLGFLCKDQGRFLGFIKCTTPIIGPVGIKGIGFDVAYKNQIYESRTITNNIRPIVNGTYDTILHAGVMSLRINF